MAGAVTESGGLSVRAFCRREGLSKPSFYFLRRELAKRDRQLAQPEAGVARNAADSDRLVAVDVIGVLGGAMLEIAVAGGVLIRLRSF